MERFDELPTGVANISHLVSGALISLLFIIHIMQILTFPENLKG
ncbi:hypothetical protein [Exilibacterium tricleocarpae]|nr:hypothetical protein [Exilibacterium tricleocarpae]